MQHNEETNRRTAHAGAASATRHPASEARQHPERNTAEDPASRDMVMRAEGDTLHVHGDIDLYKAGLFRQQAEAHIRNTQQPRLDLTAVPFLDSAGLAALLALSREAKAQGKTLRLKIIGSPRRVLRITGIDRMLTLEE